MVRGQRIVTAGFLLQHWYVGCCGTCHDSASSEEQANDVDSSLYLYNDSM
jgi:hypothetical protein